MLKQESGNGMDGLKKTKKNSIKAMSRASFEPSTYKMRVYIVATASRRRFTRRTYVTADSTHKICIWVIVKHLRHIKQLPVEAVNIFEPFTLAFI
jgi:hypothetical protein